MEMSTSRKDWPRLSIISLAWLALAVFIYVILSENVFPFLGWHLPRVPQFAFVKIAAAFLAAFACFVYGRGLKLALGGAACVMSLAWVLEFLAGHLGFFGGTYQYLGEFPGPVLGGTPLLLAPQHYAYYFFMSYFISNLLVVGTALPAGPLGWKKRLYASFVGSIVVAGIDMMADPTQVNVYHLWRWDHPSPYYAIPYGNYLGYLVVYTILLFVYRRFEEAFHARPLGSCFSAMACVPLILHATRYVEYSSSGLGGIALIGGFTMLFPCLLAAGRLVECRKQPAV